MWIPINHANGQKMAFVTTVHCGFAWLGSEHLFSNCHIHLYYMTAVLKSSIFLQHHTFPIAHKLGSITVATVRYWSPASGLHTPREVGFTNIAPSHCPVDIFLKLLRVITKNSCCFMVEGVLVIRLLQDIGISNQDHMMKKNSTISFCSIKKVREKQYEEAIIQST